MQEESDLVYYGKFSYLDVENMTTVDRNYHLRLVNDRIKRLNEKM